MTSRYVVVCLLAPASLQTQINRVSLRIYFSIDNCGFDHVSINNKKACDASTDELDVAVGSYRPSRA